MAKFVSIMSGSEDHPVFIDADNILMVSSGQIAYVTGETAKLIDIYAFHYNKIVEKIEEYSADKWIDLGNVVKDIGPLFINKAYFKGLNFVGGNYQIIVERGYYEGELPIQNLSIDDAKKIIDAISD